MVTVLVLIIALGVLQVALALHTRNTLTSCASEGARVAAVDTAAAGVDRARECARDSLGVAAQASAEQLRAGSLDVVRITLTATPPAFSLWRPGDLEASGRALLEGGDDAR